MAIFEGLLPRSRREFSILDAAWVRAGYPEPGQPGRIAPVGAAQSILDILEVSAASHHGHCAVGFEWRVGELP